MRRLQACGAGGLPSCASGEHRHHPQASRLVYANEETEARTYRVRGMSMTLDVSGTLDDALERIEQRANRVRLLRELSIGKRRVAYGGSMNTHCRLSQLSSLLKRRNSIEAEIAQIIGRPAERGHIGEFVASEIFDIELHDSATHEGSDGVFRNGPFSGKSVNIKCYGKNEGILDMNPASPPDFYLVLTGLRTGAESSRGAVRPWTISSVFLFHHRELASRLSVKIGIATSVRRHFWDTAEIYPSQESELLMLTGEQRSMLQMFKEP